MKSLVVSVLIVVFLTLSSSVAIAQDCGKARVVLKAIMKAAKKVIDEVGCRYLQAQTGTPVIVCKKGQDVIGAFKKKMRDAMKKFWKKMVKNSWATIGPRDLKWKKSHKGTIVGRTARMFVAQGPNNKKTRKFVVRKRGGKAKTGVAICVQDMITGKFKRLKKHIFKKGTGGKSFSYTVKNAVGKIFMVHFAGKSVAKKFQYTLTVK
jgi:hypothetical protein